MVRFLIERPIAVNIVFVALFILGLISYKTLPVSMLPDIPIPEVTVMASYPGYNSRNMEDLITKRLCRALMETTGLEDIKSETREGYCLIKLRFSFKTNVDYAAIEVNEKIDRLTESFPDDMDRPVVIKASATDIPVLNLNITLKDYKEKDLISLSRFINSVLKKRIEQIPEIAIVDVTGIDKPQVTISPDPAKFEPLGLTYRDIEQTFNNNNINFGNLIIKDGHYQYNVRFSTQINNINDLENIFLNAGSKVVQLKDIAAVTLIAQKRTGMFMYGHKSAISMAIIKKANAKLHNLKQSLSKQIEYFKTDYPEIEFEISNDQSTLLDYSISNLSSSLIVGSILAVIVVFIFLSSVRLPLIITLSVPMSLVISILFFMIFKISINIISLSGLVLAVGMMVDNSIIIIDNITQAKERGLSLLNACISGTNEMITPLLSSALTTCAVFLPLVFMSGITGALFFDQAVTIAIGLMVSFCVSITFLPVFYFLIYGRKEEKQGIQANNKHKHEWFDYLIDIYSNSLDIVFKYKKTVLAICLICLILTFWLAIEIRKETFPQLPETETVITIDWNESKTVEALKNEVNNMLQTIDNQIIQSSTWIGIQDYLMQNSYNLTAHETKIYINAGTQEKVDNVRLILANLLKTNYPNAKFQFEEPDNVFNQTFSQHEAPFILRIHPGNHEITVDNLKALIDLTNSSLADTSTSKVNTSSYLSIQLDLERLLLYQIPVYEVESKIKTAFSENRIGYLKSYNEVIPVIVGGNEISINEILKTITIKSQNGQDYNIGNFVSVTPKTDFEKLYGGIDGEYFPIMYNISSQQAPEYEDKISTMFANLSAQQKQAYDFSFSGNLYYFKSLLNEMTVILLVSVLLLYFILAAQFESLLQPLIVLIEIPIDVAAALFILYITGNSLNIMAVIGIIVMGGIVVNDSIIKVDTMNQLYRHEKMPLMEAIHEGGKRRLRPILMTSITTIVALIPLFFSDSLGSEIQKPLALTLIAGLSFGTLVSIYVIPLVYWLIYRK